MYYGFNDTSLNFREVQSSILLLLVFLQIPEHLFDIEPKMKNERFVKLFIVIKSIFIIIRQFY